MSELRVVMIDATTETVRETWVPRGSHGQLMALQHAVGGYIELARNLGNGDVVVVNEEGKLHAPQHFFRFKDRPGVIYAGNGVVLGPVDDEGDATPALSDVEALASTIQFGHKP